MWILERKGTDFDDKREFATIEEAQIILKTEYYEVLREFYSPMGESFDENYAYIADEEYYQSWHIYELIDYGSSILNLLAEIELELDRADTGVDQYVFELSNTDVAKIHIWEAQRLLRQLKEMV